MNRFQRCASNYAYYNYLTHYNPSQLRLYQTQRHYSLGRKGAYNTLILKMAADHINYEEDFNMRYKTHPIIVNLSMRVCMYWFVMSCLMISVSLGDMTKLFTTHEYWYPAQPPEDPEQIARYETLYMFDRPPVF